MKLAIVGITGLVGNNLLKVLEERNLPIEELFGCASVKSVGKEFKFKGKKHIVISIEDAISRKPDIAIFSAGSKVSRQYAPLFAETGTFVIDNSSEWRMKDSIPLIVPEVNASILTEKDRIISNPNCSTIQLVVAMAPLHRKFTLKRIIISTYQSVTGTGQKAVMQLMDERENRAGDKVYKYQIDLNCFPHGGDFLENGYTTEEMKLVNETRKILGDDDIQVSATVVRIPVIGGHSESVNAEFENKVNVTDIKETLSAAEGVVLMDDPANAVYPMPFYAKDKDEVFVGRVRPDFTNNKAINLWIVADNLRKGAATNAVQIAEYLIYKKLVS
jgi:aspartate-semialdehyde dehydrogenase